MKRVFVQIGTAIICACVLAYVIMQLSLSKDTGVTTEHAFYSVVNSGIKANAYIFRDETVVMQSGGGARSYSVRNGEKVHLNQPLCSTYQNADEAGMQEAINIIDDKIALLNRSNIKSSSYSTDLAKVNTSISEYMQYMQRCIAEGDLAAAERSKDELLLQMNRRVAIVSDDKDYFGSRISALERQKAELQLGQSGVKVTTTSPAAGYFYTGADGYENMFSVSALENLNVDRFKQLITQKPSDTVLNTAIGKISRSSKWYIAFMTERREAANFKEGTKYTVLFPYNDNREIAMQFERVIGDAKTDEVVLVFSTNVLPGDFNFTRMQEVNVIKSTVQGLKIRTTALRNENGQTGVYVLSSGIVGFKTAEVLCEEGGFYVVQLPNPKDRCQRSDTKLSLHDTVITGGKGLYVGKVVQ